ncbi:MAG: inositol monophosphatase family protein [Pseudomonadota bacterium]|nr:inositol monophosphatase family protein [Pseudomonadota bacterium]
MRHFGGGDPRRKADGTWLTDADLAAEAVLLEAIHREWPEDTILSEERGAIAGHPDARWVVDPLDGTSAFTEGLAHWGPAVARLVRDGASERVDFGAIYLPRLGEHFHVEGGVGWFNGAVLPPLDAKAIPRVLYLPSAFHRHFNVAFAGKARCLGGTAAHLALVARGSALAAIVAPGWSIWDTAAGLALIEAVGGRALRLPHGGLGPAPLDPFRDTGAAFIAGEATAVAELASLGRVAPRRGLESPISSFSEGARHGRTGR